MSSVSTLVASRLLSVRVSAVVNWLMGDVVSEVASFICVLLAAKNGCGCGCCEWLGYDFVASLSALDASAQVANVVACSAAGVRMSSQALRLFGSMPMIVSLLPGVLPMRFSAAAFRTGRSAASSMSPSEMRITLIGAPLDALSLRALMAAPGRVMVRMSDLLSAISAPSATMSCFVVSVEPAAMTSMGLLSNAQKWMSAAFAISRWIFLAVAS